MSFPRAAVVVALIGLGLCMTVLVPLVSASGSDVTLSATSLAFADRLVGTTADAQAVRVTNTGDAPLSISTFRINGPDAGDFAQGSDCPISPDTVAVAGSCTIYVSFTPHSAGPKSATLSIGDDAASSPQDVALTGGGISAPQVSLAPTSAAFGAVQVGDHSASQTVTLSNTGAAALALSAIRLAGADAADFTHTTTCDLTAGLPAGGSCTIAVVFAPGSPGAKSATLAFDDDAPNTPQSVALTGTATPAPIPSVGLSPTTLTFAAQTVGTTGAQQSVTITNTGGADLAVASIGITGSSDFAQTNNCPATLASGASCSASVTFAPTGEGTRAAHLTLSDNAANTPQSVALSGTGLAAGTYFGDDFESGSLSRWDALSSSDSTIALDSDTANSGNTSVRFSNHSDQQSSRLMADLAGGGHAQSYTRFCFRIAPGLTQGIEIANGRAINAINPLGIRRWEVVYNPVTKGLEGYFFNDALQRLDMYAANGRVFTGQWYCAELYLDESVNGHAELWLDGVSVGTVDGDLGTPDPYSRVYLWNQPTAGNVWFDDVKVAATQIGSVGAGDGHLPGPGASLSPTTAGFGAQSLGSAGSAQTVTLTNNGALPLAIHSIGVTGSAAADFSQTNDCPATLAPAASCAASVTFAPTVTGARSAALTLNDNADNSPQAVPLSGTGVIAGTYLSDDFETGSLSQWDALSSSDSNIALDSSVSNSGSGSVRFTNTSNDQSSRLMADLAGGGHAQSYTRWCFRIAPGVSDGIEIANGRAIDAEYPLGIRRFVIDYNPGTKGLEGYFFNENLDRVDMSAATGRVLTGRWYCAELYLDESASGHAKLWLDGVPVGSVDGDLSTPNPYSRFYLWNQATAGTVWFDDVKVADAPIGPVGAGGGDLPGPQVVLSPTTLDFGSQTTQLTSSARTVTLTNTGGSALTISNVALTGAAAGDFAQTNTCPQTLAAGASCTASVTFTPSTVGARSASLSVTDDASGTPHTVALTGTGAAPAAAVATASPASVSFGDQVVDTTSAAKTVTLSNTGSLPMSIDAITIAGGDAADFARTSTCPSGAATLAVGASCTIDVTLTPSVSGNRTATLSISGNAVNSPATVALSGAGTLPSGTLFTDAFENGLGAWKTVGAGSAATGPGGENGNRAELSHAQPAIGMYADFPTQGQVETHTRFCLLGAPQFASVLAQGRDVNGQNLWELDYDPGINGLDIYAWNGAHVRRGLFATNVFIGGWTCVDVDFDQAVAGHFVLSINGAEVASATGDFSAPDNYGRLMFWNTSANGTVIVDDVSVKDS